MEYNNHRIGCCFLRTSGVVYSYNPLHSYEYLTIREDSGIDKISIAQFPADLGSARYHFTSVTQLTQ